MRAKRNFKIKLLICCLMVLLLGTLLVACNKYTPDRYDYLVTFCYNLGNKISGNAPDVYLGVRDADKEAGVGALVSIRPGYNTDTFREASVAGYYLKDWYLPKLDAERNIVKDEDGKVVLEDTPFDFEHTRIHEHTTLYAKLVKSPRMLFVDADTEDVVSEIDGKKPGERRAKPSSVLAPKKVVDGEPYTFMGKYYEDKECTREFPFPYIFQDDDVNVYCKFIKGEWALVSTAREYINAIENRQNIYLMNDIDFAGQTYSPPESYNAELNGRGFTIRNIAISRTGSNSIDRFSNNTNFGIFKTLMGRAYIHDVTFENVTIDISTSSSYQSVYNVRIGFLAGEASEGARLENITLSGRMTCNEHTRSAQEKGYIMLDTFIAVNRAKSEQIVNCDRSGVKLIYLS